MNTPDSETVHELTRHVDFARRLARRLVADPNDADDIAQQALASALGDVGRVRSRDGAGVRAFLATLVRRGAGRSRRSTERRVHREEAVARDEALPSTADLAAAMEVHRRVVDAVLALDATSREALLLRFFEDLPPREIARRLGLPVETVRTRTRRAIERVRERLSAKERKTLAALAFAPSTTSASPPGVATDGTLRSSVLATACAVGAVGLAAWLASGGSSSEAPPGTRAAPRERSVAALRESTPLEADVDRRTPVAEAPRVSQRTTSPAALEDSASDSALPPRFDLRVIDAETGVDLDRLLVLKNVLNAGDGVFPNNWSDANVHLRDAASPLALSSGFAIARYWLHRPGYGWRDVRVDHSVPGRRTVELVANGATVDVHIASASDEVRANDAFFVRAYAVAHEELPVATLPATDALDVELGGLPAGEYEVRAELGTRFAPRLVLARERIVLRPGGRERVELRCDDPLASYPTAPLGGTIVMPEGEARDATHSKFTRLSIRPLGPQLRPGDVWSEPVSALAPTGDDGRTLRFDAGDITVGAYVLAVDAYGFEREIALAPGGLLDVRVELPRFVRARVFALDRDSGEPVLLSRLGWKRGTSLAHGGLLYRRVAGEPGAFELDLPIGDVVLGGLSETHSDGLQHVRIDRDEQVVELRLARRAGFWLRLLDDATPVPPGTSHRIRVTTARGTREHLGYHTGRGFFVVDAPGRIRVEIDPLRGFRPVPAQTFDVSLEGPNELDVQLVRAPAPER